MSETPNISASQSAPIKPKKYMIFHVAGNKYATPLSSVREVIALQTHTAVPGMPEHFKGLINLRGKVISTFDLKLRLGLKEQKSKFISKRPIVIVTQLGDEIFGLIVDYVSEVLLLSESQIDRKIEQIEDSKRQGVVGAVRMESQELTLILDLTKLGQNVEVQAA